MGPRYVILVVPLLTFAPLLVYKRRGLPRLIRRPIAPIGIVAYQRNGHP